MLELNPSGSDTRGLRSGRLVGMDDPRQLWHGFEVHAHEEFDALLAGSGFRCVESRPDLLRYESRKVFFEVGYAVHHDNEVYASIGRVGVFEKGKIAERLSFGFVLLIADPDAHSEMSRTVRYAIAHSEAQVRWMLSYYACGCRSHGQALLSGEAGAYKRARKAIWRFASSGSCPPEALTRQPWWQLW
jgi:hypothetical protein